jgi:exosortase
MTSAAVTQTDKVISRKEKRLLGLLLLFTVFAFHQLFLEALAADFMPDVVEAFFSVSGISFQFLYALVLGLIFIRRKDIAAAYHGRGSPLSAMLFLLPGISLFLWGHFVDATDLIHVSFILIVFGAARFLSGRQLTRVLLAPTLILVLGTPLPAVLINQIIFPMQLWDTEHSVWLLNAIGIPALAMGDMISMAEGSTRFAESCTALGFTLWLTIFALAYVYIFRITRWHAVLLVLSAPIIAHAVNLLRAFSLVLNPKMEVLAIHTFQGIVFFLLGFSLLYAVDNLLIRYFDNGDKVGKAESTAMDKDELAGQKTGKLYVLATMLLALSVISFIMPTWPAPQKTARQAISLPDELGEWKFATTLPVKYSFLGSVRYSSTLYNGYIRNSEPVNLFIGTDDRLRRDRSSLSGKNGYPDGVGLEQERSIIDLGPDITHAESIVIDDVNAERWLSYHWYEGIESVAKEILYALLALDQSPFRRDEPARVTRLTTYVELTPEGRQQADKRLRTFLREIKKAGTTTPQN